MYLICIFIHTHIYDSDHTKWYNVCSIKKYKQKSYLFPLTTKIHFVKSIPTQQSQQYHLTEPPGSNKEYDVEV